MTKLITRTPLRKSLAWGVHLYTALGLVVGSYIAVLIVQGGDASFRLAFILMGVAILIDATDGTFARLVKVKQVLPQFDGQRLDEIIDFVNYTVLPLLLIWRAGILPAGMESWLMVPLLASAYGFCQVSAKTDDGYFLGFPSYWNLVAFYLYFLKLSPGFSLLLILVFSFLTFVPTRYLYLSQKGRLNMFTNVLAAVWAFVLILILLGIPAPSSIRRLLMLSLLFPIYYIAVSWFISVRIRRERMWEMRVELNGESSHPGRLV